MLSLFSEGKPPALYLRYPKLTDTQLDTVDDLAEEVGKGVLTSGGFPLMLGLGVGAGVAAVSGVPIVGAVAGGYFIYNAVSTAIGKGKAAQYIKDQGCLAHCLSESQLIRYIEVLGPDAVLAELQQAYRDGEQVTSAGKRFAKSMEVTLQRRTIKGFMAEYQASQQNIIAATDAATAPTDGDKPSTPQKSQAISAATDTGEKVTKDVVSAYLDDLRCTVMAAPPRTGKGIVAAAMMTGFKLAYPAGKLFTCTIKQFAGEDWYFESSDYHINPDRRDPLELARQLFSLYQAWEESNSNADAPSLLVIDEIRDTLLAVANVEMADVSAERSVVHPKFADWLRAELISSATLNQCHKRYVLLISPVSTATAMGFKDANSLNSYASFTLVTPSELAFSEGNNGVFAAPAIRADSSLFSGWYGLGWSKKSKAWFGVPPIDAAIIRQRETTTPNLNYFIRDSWMEQVYDELPERLRRDYQPGTSTATIPNTIALPEPQTNDERWADEIETLYGDACNRLRQSPGKAISISNLIKNEKARKRHGVALIGRLSNNGNVEYATSKRGNVTTHLFTWLDESEDDEFDLE